MGYRNVSLGTVVFEHGQVNAVDEDPLGFRAGHRRVIIWLVLLLIVLGVSMVAGVVIGSVNVPVPDTLSVIQAKLLGSEIPQESRVNEVVIWEIRTPRVILGALVGAGLAMAGLVLQALVRNMLADPYIIGINSGASCGAAAAILFGLGAGLGEYALQGSAFIGATLASLLIFFVARSQGRMTSIRLLMAGVAIGYALSALTSFMIFASDSAEGSRSVMFWLLGSLGLANWNGALLAAFVVVIVVGAFLWLCSRMLDALTLGDETALTLGIHPERFRMIMLVASCLLVGTLVAMAGSIGFVGLVIPHFARRLVGGAHRAAIPVAALLGSILLLWADILARWLLAPEEVPIGIITALVGAPFLVMLVRRMYAPTSA